MLILDHIGIAVENLEESIAAYQRDFAVSVDFKEELPERGIALAFLKLPGSTIELLAATSESSVIKRFIDTRGPGIHHVAYRVKNIDTELSRLKSLGHQLIDEKARPGARGSEIAFLHPKSFGGVLIELVQLAN